MDGLHDNNGRISFTVNGEAREVSCAPSMRLSEVLREALALRATKVGCNAGDCGACTVLFDGRPVKSCTMLAVQADGHDVETVEGMGSASELHPVQEGFKEEHGLQCGYCTPGMITRAHRLLQENPNPTEEEVRFGIAGNLCRCTGYQNIVKAILAAAAKMNEMKESA